MWPPCAQKHVATNSLGSARYNCRWLLISLCIMWMTTDIGAQQDNDEMIQVVSPIVNRKLETSVVADGWPSTPQNVLCEAYAYHERNPLSARSFLSNLVQLIGSTETSAVPSFVGIALESSPLEGSARALLSYALSLRAYSPQCELHRSLARQALLERVGEDPILDETKSNVDVFAVVYPSNALLFEDELLATDFSKLPKPTSGETIDSFLLPDEIILGHQGTSSADEPLVTLYANLGSMAFVRAYRHLIDTASVRFVVRYLGDAQIDKLNTTGAASDNGSIPTVLQGYGVRLDIRNVEYKVFDDRTDHSEGNHDEGLVDLRADLDPARVPQEFLAGVNTTSLGLNVSSVASLWRNHARQQGYAQLVPPVWQRRQLPLQAATILSQAREDEDVLETLQQIAQDLPSIASTLVHVKIDETVQTVAKALEKDRLLRRGALYVNGRVVAMDRTTFNVFEFLNVLQEEYDRVETLQSLLGKHLSIEGLQAVQKAWMQGETFLADATGQDSSSPKNPRSDVFRVDVARGGKDAIFYLNNIEKDRQYRQWPRSVQQMLMSMQFGMPPMVRRNLFTMLAVIDPIENHSNLGLELGFQLMQNSFPARVGTLLVSAKDVQACRDWVLNLDENDNDLPCPTEPILARKPSAKDLEKMPATTHALHRLVSVLSAEFVDQPEAVMAYVEYILSAIGEHQETQGFLSLSDLLSLHGNLMDGMQVMSTQKAQAKALDDLVGLERSEFQYGKALRFAVEKRILPGMSFLNGRPLPTASDDLSKAISDTFAEEQNHVFNMVVEGAITDDSPRSVYAKILTGDRVFPFAHPLLMGGDKDQVKYLLIEHSFAAESLLAMRNTATKPDARFILEMFLDFTSPQGVDLATRIITILEELSPSLKVSDEESQIMVGYRLLPSTQNAADSVLCPVMEHASLFGVHLLKKVLSKHSPADEARSLDSFLQSVSGVPKDLRKQILQSASQQNACNSSKYLLSNLSLPAKNFVVGNGRVFSLENSSIGKENSELLFNLKLLLQIELARAKAVSSLLREHLVDERVWDCDAVALAACFLAVEQDLNSRARFDIAEHIEKALSSLDDDLFDEVNPLRFSWNKNSKAKLRVDVVAVLDPATEAAQRISPLLKVIRDQLELPVAVFVCPETIIDSDSKVPITSYYRFVADPASLSHANPPSAHFSHLPANHVLTLRMDIPEPWDVQQTAGVQDTDNLRCDLQSGCGDRSNGDGQERVDLTSVQYGLKSLLVFGQCFESNGKAPNGLQLTLTAALSLGPNSKDETLVGADVEMDGSLSNTETKGSTPRAYSDTLVMKNAGYWQLRANPGVWYLSIANESKGADLFDFVDGEAPLGKSFGNRAMRTLATSKRIVMNDFVNRGELLVVKRRAGYEDASLFDENERLLSSTDTDEVINVFSLATGHLYERFLKIMMLSVTKRTSTKVKFWLFENFLSPTFKITARAMAERIGCEVEFVTYKWPEWLRNQSEKQRIIWGYKILFLDVLFPLNVKKIIYVDADQVVRGDLKELWDMDLQGAPYGYTPFCTSRESTLGYQFWRDGFWKSHLQGKPYHISALYVVDLENFRRTLVGDQLRSIYQQLSGNPDSLANLDQDLPNYAQHQVPIFSLPQEWLWCESWCSDETKGTAKTIDLCNNPEHKEPKVSMAKRIVSGPLFNESWVELDAEVEMYEQAYFKGQL